jgi:transposase InsO family protein
VRRVTMACMIARRHRTVARERSVNERFGRSFEPGGASGGVPIGSVPCSVTHGSTVYGVLRRHHVPRLGEIDRPTRQVVRYERARPGELVHIDVKKLGRIRPGGGHRILGRAPTTGVAKRQGVGYDYLHTAVDDHSRLAYVEVHVDERAPTTAGFLERALEHFNDLGATVKRVMTDNAWCYTRSRAFTQVLGLAGARHVLIRPRHPQTNGKVERFHRTLLEEWAYARLYRSNDARLATLPRWLETYNHRRPHTALGGLPPISRVSTT